MVPLVSGGETTPEDFRRSSPPSRVPENLPRMRLHTLLFAIPFTTTVFAQPDLDSLDAYLARTVKAFDQPGLAVGIVKDGALIDNDAVISRIREVARPFISDESDDFIVVRLPKSTHISKLLQRIRDESHRFAVSYHTHLKRTGQVKSVLDSIPGVGPTTRKRLLKAFGSTSAISQASIAEIASEVGLIKAKTIKTHFKNTK